MLWQGLPITWSYLKTKSYYEKGVEDAVFQTGELIELLKMEHRAWIPAFAG
jgi:hypothetical protein